MLTVAPYWLPTVNQEGAAEDKLHNLFQKDPVVDGLGQAVSDKGRELGAYEINLQTTQGSSTADARNAVVTVRQQGQAWPKI